MINESETQKRKFSAEYYKGSVPRNEQSNVLIKNDIWKVEYHYGEILLSISKK